MSKALNKKVKRIKHNHVWGRIIILIIVSLAMLAVAKFFTYFLGTYILRTKMTSEYVLISNMAHIYEDESQQEPEKTFALLDSMNRDYLIVNSEGTIVHSCGSNSITKEKLTTQITTDFNYIEVYKDAHNYFNYDKNGNFTIDYKSVFFGILENKNISEQLEKDNNTSTDWQNLDRSINDIIQLPIWIALPAKDGQEKLIGKAFFNINLMDFILFDVFIAIVFGLGIVLIIFLIHNIIHEEIHHIKSKKLLFCDDTTKGHNYTWFLYTAGKFLSKRANAQKEFAVIDLQFVKFRNFCACHSIQEGEKQLKNIYDAIKKELQCNEIVAHSTPANFVLMLACPDVEQVKTRMQNLIANLEKISRAHTFKFHSGISVVGVRKNAKDKIVRRKNHDPEIDYNNACTARATLNESEDSGVAVFDDKIIEEQKWKNEVQEEQMNALKNEEFIVYYQPKYNPGTEKLCGAEALIRWQSPKHGFVPPGRFIPIFEKNGFITEIDHYMLSHVARDMKQWQDAGMNCVPVSVNVSRAHFIETDLAEQIRDIVDEAGADRRLIEIELTESAFFDDKKALVSTILKLKEYGFAVSMDDFGSGYSSLNSLKDMPLDILKIDAEFFRGESADTRGKIVVSETIKLAKSLNMRTVAEGVEIKEQVDFLAEQGCDMIQGFYFAKPMPKNEFEDRMK